MPKINKPDIYLPDTDLHSQDNWVGTNYNNFDNTQTFYLGDVAAFIATNFADSSQNNKLKNTDLGSITVTNTKEDDLVSVINALANFDVLGDEIQLFTGSFIEENSVLDTKFVYGLTKGKGNYGVGGTQITTSDILLYNPKQPETERNTSIIDALISVDKIHSGDIIWREGTMTFDVVNFVYTINGVTYIPADTFITLDDSSVVAGENRIDVFVADANTGGVVVLKGDYSASPQEPVIAFGEQLYINSVYIPANATEPQVEPGVDFVIDLITDETDSEPDEWNLINTPTNVDVNDTTTTPYKNTKSINFASDASGLLTYKKDTLVTYDATGYLQFGLKLSQPLSEGNYGGSNPNLSIIKISLSNSTDPAQRPSNFFLTARNNTIGLTPFNNYTTDWQAINIPMSRFQYTINNNPAQFDTFSVEMIRCGQLNIDDVKMQVGINTPTETEHVERTSQLVNDGDDTINPFLSAKQKEVTANYTLLPTDHSNTIWLNSASAFTVTVDDTLPTNFECYFYNVGAGTVTFVSGTGVIDTPEGSNLVTNKTCIVIKKESDNDYKIKGDLLL